MILIAIGANLVAPDGSAPIQTCRKALCCLAALPGLRLIAASRWWQSAPIPPADQPLYINGVARFEGHVEPEDLLRQLQRIEADFGRVRTGQNAPRVLDLDIIAIDSTVRDAPDPILPHPRAHARAFVLAPLSEVAPTWVHPIKGRSASSLLAELPLQICDPIKSADDGKTP